VICICAQREAILIVSQNFVFQTYEYAKTIIDLMCRHPHPDGKILIIGGGIANFTNVADTLKGIIRAIRETKDRLKEHNTKVVVRRGGPNYKEGLRYCRFHKFQLSLFKT